jgi:hypothetical protein
MNQATILEHQRLDGHYAGQHQHRRPRAEQNRRQRRAQQVAGRPPCHGKVEHLPGEDGRRHHPHHRHLALAQVFADPLERHHHHGRRDQPENG